MGDDLDAALSTVLLLSLNPNLLLIGIYNTYKEIYYYNSKNTSFTKLIDSEKIIWLDLDIYHHTCKSLGHHIVRFNSGNLLKGFKNSCNPNELQGHSVTNRFTEKYPLGTIHFLMWLFGLEIPEKKYADKLIWLADSAFINAQSHRFRKNAGYWLKNIFPVPSLATSFEKEIETKNFENEMVELHAIMKDYGFKKGNGQVRSKHIKLSGFQCQPDYIPGDVIRLLLFVSEITGWKFNKNQIKLDRLTKKTGSRFSKNIK